MYSRVGSVTSFQFNYNYNYSVLKISNYKNNYNYFHTYNWLQVEITDSFKNMKKYSQTCWNDSRSGARSSFSWALERSTHLVFHRVSNYFLPILTPCEFRVSTELQYLISCRCYYTTVDYQRKHLLSQLKQQQLIVWTMIGHRKRFLEYNSNKIQHSPSAV